MREPRRCVELERLDPGFRVRIESLLGRMRELGWDPLVFETYRSGGRQEWLYGIGRTHHRHQRPVTWVRHSRHQDGLAVDIISARGFWDDVGFFDGLELQAGVRGLRTLRNDRCHVERG